MTYTEDRRLIPLLENDERRQNEMRRLLGAAYPHLQLALFDNAPQMIKWLPENLKQVALNCLDHDLGPSRIVNRDRFEPGSGRDVADFSGGP